MTSRLLRSPFAARFIRRQMQSLCGTGVILGTLFFAASLAPSLVPRSYLMQGALAGASFAIGYGIGVFCRWLWHYLELPDAPPRLRSMTNALLAAASLIVVIIFLWQSAAWQNAVRAAMGMKPVGTAHPFEVCAIAFVTFVVLLVLARLFRLISRFTSRHIQRLVPRRVANVIGVLIALLLFWSVGNDIVIGAVFRSLDLSYGRFDALLEPDRPQPTDPNRTGSTASLLKWTDLGRAGREFVATGPTAQQISAITGHSAKQPIRVYVGLRSADTPEARAKLALEELKRQGGFDRSILIVITPTGTGWVDPSGMDPVEYLHDGDVASVAVQYSYLSSPLTLLAQPEYGASTARALFREIYNYWTTLPRDHRPSLYLFGLSLGAMNSEKSVDLSKPFEIRSMVLSGAAPLSRVDLALDHPQPQSRLSRMASGIPRWPACAVHELGWFAGACRCSVGADAHCVPAIRERPDRIFRLPGRVPASGLDAGTAWPGCVTKFAMVSHRHDAPTRRRYAGGDEHPDGVRSCLCA